MRQDKEKLPTELTAPHRALIDIIDDIGFQVIAEYPVGKYTLDCYLPEFHVGIEADGPHHSKSRDKKRRNKLMDDYELPVLHLTTEIIMLRPAYVLQTILEFVQDFEENIAERKACAEKYERGLSA